MCYICHHQPTSLTFSIKKTEVPGSIDIVKLNRKKQANLISPVKASPFPTQQNPCRPCTPTCLSPSSSCHSTPGDASIGIGAVVSRK